MRRGPYALGNAKVPRRGWDDSDSAREVRFVANREPEFVRRAYFVLHEANDWRVDGEYFVEILGNTVGDRVSRVRDEIRPGAHAP